MEENKAIERRFMEEVWNQGRLEVADELFATDVVVHNYPVPAPGVEGIKQVIAASRAGLPDTHMAMEDLVAEGDRVAVRWTYRGTHRHEFLGLPPTGKQIILTGMHIDRFAGGKIVERWVETDLRGMLQQLGSRPDATEAST